MRKKKNKLTPMPKYNPVNDLDAIMRIKCLEGKIEGLEQAMEYQKKSCVILILTVAFLFLLGIIVLIAYETGKMHTFDEINKVERKLKTR